MELYPCFSTPIFVDHINYDYNKSYIESLEYREYSNKTGFMSSNSNILLEDEFSSLKEQIEEKLNFYLFEILKFKEGKIKHVLSWINVHQPGQHSHLHCHSNSCYSGIFYLKYPTNGGKTWFHHPAQVPTYVSNTINPLLSEYNIFNSKSWFVDSKDNMLVLFPSHLDHSTEDNNSSENRYSLAFNYFIEGKIGSSTSELSLFFK